MLQPREQRAAHVLASIAANVRRWRERRGLSQAALAEAADMEVRAVQRVEAGRINFGVVALVSLADALNVSVSLLLRPALLERPRRGRPPRRTERSRR
jgi:transcriptional regulator with XRE-family HTH domain